MAGFDIKQDRIDELRAGCDATLETEETVLRRRMLSRNPLPAGEMGSYHGVVAAVGHREFAGVDPREWVAVSGVVYDVKGIYDRAVVDGRL